MEDKKDFTYDKVNFAGLPEFADYLHAKGQKYILILVRAFFISLETSPFLCHCTEVKNVLSPSLSSSLNDCQDPAIATSKRVGNASYESYDRGTAKNAWVFESDGKTPLVGEVGPR